MNGTAVIRMLLNGSFNMIQERLDGMTDEEWRERALPGTSKLGFILWHCTRILDWTVHCAFQGVPEVEDLNGLPTWQILVRPCGAHIRRHMGEYDVLMQALRARGVVTPRA